MDFRQLIDKLEPGAEFTMEAGRIIAVHGQPTALHRSLRPERGNDDVPFRLYRMGHLPDIGCAIPLVDQEMKDRPIVPDIIGMRPEWKRRHVALKPLDEGSVRSDSVPSDLERCRGQVQH